VLRKHTQCLLFPAKMESVKMIKTCFTFCCPCISLQILASDQLDTLFHVFIYFISLYMFRTLQCSSSGDQIVLIHHLVWLVCVSDCLVCQSLLTGIPSSHLHRLIILDYVLIQFDLLMMSTVMFETCRERWNK